VDPPGQQKFLSRAGKRAASSGGLPGASLGLSPGPPALLVHHRRTRGGPGQLAQGEDRWWRENEALSCDSHVGRVFLAVGDLCRDVSEAWGWVEPSDRGGVGGGAGKSKEGAGESAVVKGAGGREEAVRRVLERVQAAQALVGAVQAQPFRRRQVALRESADGSLESYPCLRASEARALLESCGMRVVPVLAQVTAPARAASPGSTSCMGDGGAGPTSAGGGAVLSASVKGAQGGKMAGLLDAGEVALGLSLAAETLERAVQVLRPLGLPGDAGGAPKKGLGLGFLKWVVAGERVSGGYVSADKGNPPRELAVNAVDGSLRTKWLHTEGGRRTQGGGDSCLAVQDSWRCTGGGGSVLPDLGGRLPGEDPKGWDLMGSSDGGDTWQVLDSKTRGGVPAAAHATGVQSLWGRRGEGEGCTVFRLQVHEIKDNSSSSILQLTGFDIFTKRALAAGMASSTTVLLAARVLSVLLLVPLRRPRFRPRLQSAPSSLSSGCGKSMLV